MKTEVQGDKHYSAWVVDGWMSMEQWWNGTDREILKYREKSIIQCRWYGWMSVDQWWNVTDRGKLK